MLTSRLALGHRVSSQAFKLNRDKPTGSLGVQPTLPTWALSGSELPWPVRHDKHVSIYGFWASGESRLRGLCPVLLPGPFASLKPFVMRFGRSDQGVSAAVEVRYGANREEPDRVVLSQAKGHLGSAGADGGLRTERGRPGRGCEDTPSCRGARLQREGEPGSVLEAGAARRGARTSAASLPEVPRLILSGHPSLHVPGPRGSPGKDSGSLGLHASGVQNGFTNAQSQVQELQTAAWVSRRAEGRPPTRGESSQSLGCHGAAGPLQVLWGGWVVGRRLPLPLQLVVSLAGELRVPSCRPRARGSGAVACLPPP